MGGATRTRSIRMSIVTMEPFAAQQTRPVRIDGMRIHETSGVAGKAKQGKARQGRAGSGGQHHCQKNIKG